MRGYWMYGRDKPDFAGGVKFNGLTFADQVRRQLDPLPHSPA
jgi:hypothetical protein